MNIDFPYADERCDIAGEAAKARGQAVQGVAPGDVDFNLCFPDGMELEAMVVPDPTGRIGLRVFWEQW